jgi:hypothetical protein
MILSTKCIVVVGMTLCAIALSSVEARETGASVEHLLEKAESSKKEDADTPKPEKKSKNKSAKVTTRRTNKSSKKEETTPPADLSFSFETTVTIGISNREGLTTEESDAIIEGLNLATVLSAVEGTDFVFPEGTDLASLKRMILPLSKVLDLPRIVENLTMITPISILFALNDT